MSTQPLYRKVMRNPAVGLPRPVIKRQPRIVEVADKNLSRLERSILRMFAVVSSRVSLKELEAGMRARRPADLIASMDLENRMRKTATGAGIPPKEDSVLEALQRIFKDGADATVTELDRVPIKKGVGAAMSFDLLSPEAIQFLESYLFDLIKEISQQQRETIRDVVHRAFQEGGHPYDQAREIKNSIGLTTQQTQAVHNFRRMLESGSQSGLSEALSRQLRDGRFDATILRSINTKTPIPQPMIDKMVQRYYDRYRQYRARNIARTETIRASAMGQQEAWRQALAQGLLNYDQTRRKWSVNRDDRLCPTCREIPGMNPDGVALDEPFATPIGPVMTSPAHPSCRCSVVLSFL